MAGRCWQREVFPTCIILRYLGQFQTSSGWKTSKKFLFWRKLKKVDFDEVLVLQTLFLQSRPTKASLSISKTLKHPTGSQMEQKNWRLSICRALSFVYYFPSATLSRDMIHVPHETKIDGSLTENWANLISHCFYQARSLQRRLFLYSRCVHKN